MDNEDPVSVLQSLGVSEALARHALEVCYIDPPSSSLTVLQVHSGNLESAADFVRSNLLLLSRSHRSIDDPPHLADFICRRFLISLTTKR